MSYTKRRPNKFRNEPQRQTKLEELIKKHFKNKATAFRAFSINYGSLQTVMNGKFGNAIRERIRSAMQSVDPTLSDADIFVEKIRSENLKAKSDHAPDNGIRPSVGSVKSFGSTTFQESLARVSSL